MQPNLLSRVTNKHSFHQHNLFIILFTRKANFNIWFGLGFSDIHLFSTFQPSSTSPSLTEHCEGCSLYSLYQQ